MSRRIILPDWMKNLPEDVKCLQQQVADLKEKLAKHEHEPKPPAYQRVDNVQIIAPPTPPMIVNSVVENPLAGVKRLKRATTPRGHDQPSIHDPTIASSSKKYLNLSGQIVTGEELVAKK